MVLQHVFLTVETKLVQLYLMGPLDRYTCHAYVPTSCDRTWPTTHREYIAPLKREGQAINSIHDKYALLITRLGSRLIMARQAWRRGCILPRRPRNSASSTCCWSSGGRLLSNRHTEVVSTPALEAMRWIDGARRARQALSLLLVPPQVGDKPGSPKPAIQFFDHLEIYPGSCTLKL